MKNKSRGFTLAELLIVVAVIAVLVAIAIPTYGNYAEKSRQTVDMATLRGSYAAAKIAEVEQAAGGVSFGAMSPICNLTDKDTNTTQEIAAFWYQPDTGELTMLTNLGDGASDAQSSGKTVFGQARTAVLQVDASGLENKHVVYNEHSLSEEGYNAQKGTVSKGILVTFYKSENDNGEWRLHEIQFAANMSVFQGEQTSLRDPTTNYAYTNDELSQIFPR